MRIVKPLLLLAATQLMTGSLAAIEFQIKDCFPQPQEERLEEALFYEEPEFTSYYPQSRFSIQGEFLYLKPTIDHPFFVITSTDNSLGDEHFPDGKRHNLQSHFEPGFRVELLYNLGCDIDFDVRFAYLNSSHSKSVSGDFLFDTIGFPGEGAQAPEDNFYAGTATQRERFQYYAGDITFNRLTLGCLPDNLTFLIGLHTAYIQRKEHFTSVGTFDAGASPINNVLRRNSIFWGIGPEIGVDYRYFFSNCCFPFAFFGNARGSILASHTEASLHYNTLRTTAVGVNLDNESVWRVTPAIDAKLGLSYDFCCYCLNGRIEVGYEWLFYNDSIDQITGYDVAFPGDTIDLYSNFNLQGPFVSLRLDF